MRPQKVPVLRNKAKDQVEPGISISAHTPLSYTKMLNELDQEENLRYTEACFQSDNLHSNKNQIFKIIEPQDKPNDKINKVDPKYQKVPNPYLPPQPPQKTSMKKGNLLQISNPNGLSQNGIQESTVYQQSNAAAIRSKLQTSLVPDPQISLGKNIVKSEIRNQVQEEINIENVSDESQILDNHMTDSNTSHFIEADFNDLMQSQRTAGPSISNGAYQINIKSTQQRKSSIKDSKGKEEVNVQQLDATAKHTSIKKNSKGGTQNNGQYLHPEEGKSLYALTHSYYDNQHIKTHKNQKESNNVNVPIDRKQQTTNSAKLPAPRQKQQKPPVAQIESQYSEGSSVMLDSRNNQIQKAVLDKVINVTHVVEHLRHQSIQNVSLLNRREQNRSPAIHNYEFVNKINDIKQQILNLERNYVGQRQQVQPPRKRQYGSQRQKSRQNQQDGQMEVVFKEHYKESPNRNHKTSNSIDSQGSQEDQFNVLNIENPVINVIPHHSSSLESLRLMSYQAFQAFGINYKKFKKTLMIQKYTDCVQFFVPERGLLINWEYSGKFYLGKCSIHRNKQYLQKQGEGNQIQPGEYIYKGEFSRGTKNGLGIINYNKGQKYQGEWKNDTFHGKGKLVTSSSRYYGQFFRGKKQGFGKELFKNGDSYQGEYDDGKFHGHGTYIWQNHTEYNGQFYNGIMEGIAEWKTANGDSYSGQYSQNQKHGQGVYKWKNGKIYKGKFEHGQPASGKGFTTKNTIPVQKQISFDGRYKVDEIDEFESIQTRKQLKKQSKPRIIITTMGELSKEQSRKGSNRSIYHGDLD